MLLEGPSIFMCLVLPVQLHPDVGQVLHAPFDAVGQKDQRHVLGHRCGLGSPVHVRGGRSTSPNRCNRFTYSGVLCSSCLGRIAGSSLPQLEHRQDGSR